MAKKVLIICYYWPPAGGPGVQRWLKFVKYLPEFDIEPIVFVPDNPSYPIIDPSLENEVASNITVIKYPIKEPYKIASALSRKHTKSISSGIVPKGKQSFVQRMLLFVRGNFFVPDARVGWIKPSVSFLTDYIEEQSIDTIISTGPPHSLHLIGMQLKQKQKSAENSNNLKWIADFRDPWTTIGYHDKLKMTSKTKARHRALEKQVLESADAIVVTSPTTAKEFALLSARPIHVITNGFDDSAVEEQELDDGFSLAHIGSLLSDRNPVLLWECLAELVQEHNTFKKDLRLKLAGKLSEEVVQAIRDFGLEAHLEILGYVSHENALILQRKAAVLLLIEIDSENTRGIIPGKLFEYLAARRPILAMGPKGSDIEDILVETQQGKYILYTEKQALKQSLLDLYDLQKSNTGSMEEESLERFHRKNLTAKLADIILN